MDIPQVISQQLNISTNQIKNVLNLLKADATVPFIARYRKELTGNLDEVAIYNIKKVWQNLLDLEKRKKTILKNLEEQGKLTEALQEKIAQITDAVILEDLYLPYKKKRQTKAEIARNNGLEPLAKIIMSQSNRPIKEVAGKFLSDKVSSTAEALAGARYIIAEWVNENMGVRNVTRRLFKQSGILHVKPIKKLEETEKAQKYLDYFDWHEILKKMPSHRLLAVLRGEKEGILRLKLQLDEALLAAKIQRQFLKNETESAEQVKIAIQDAIKRLLLPSISTETLNYFKEQADKSAIRVFSENLRQLLLASPLGEKRVLAIDPGFRTGCKIVCLNKQGALQHHDAIFPHPPKNDRILSTSQLKFLVQKYQIEAIAIGNGTASRETEAFIKQIKFEQNLPVFIVNEAGASIYSASEIAREEFPDKDITVRGAVSIGRRLQDPLAELVKIDPKSIGVGQYQYDVNQNLLKEELNNVVEQVVNLVGVNLNTASQYLLRYVSGIGPKLAKNIVDYRQEHGLFKNRKELLKVKGLGAKAFEQSAGFLRIKNADNPLDNSAVHPESYPIVERMAKSLDLKISEIIGRKDVLKKIDLNKFLTQKTQLPTLKDIINELEKPGLDIRQKAEAVSFSPELKTIDDVKINQTYPGVVNNITDFGCFINIGIKESGLIHISNLSNSYVRHPSEILKLNQAVDVKVLSLDIARKRIGLSLVSK